MELTTKQEKFVQNLVAGMTQRQAYIKAGYSTKGHSDITIDSNASRLFANNKVLTRYKELLAEHKDKALWTREQSVNSLKWLLQKAMKSIDEVDHGYVKKGTADAMLEAIKELNKIELLYPLDIKKVEKIDSELSVEDDLQNDKITQMINKLDEVYGDD